MKRSVSRFVFIFALVLPAALAAAAGDSAQALKITGIRAVHHDGQTFITWTDVAPGAAGEAYRYEVYRSAEPITAANLDQATRTHKGILNNSAKCTFAAWKPQLRNDTSGITCVIVPGGERLPDPSGLAVKTAVEGQTGRAYYAVVAVDLKGARVTSVVPGESATTEPVEEKVAPIRPIQIKGDASLREVKESRPLIVSLHASAMSLVGPGGTDQYLYWGTPEMGWRDGLQSHFGVAERKTPGEPAGVLTLTLPDAVMRNDGKFYMQTSWLGYRPAVFDPDADPLLFVNYTERKLLWVIDWVLANYAVDRNRIYLTGGSMGATGTHHFGPRHPELFAATSASRGRVRRNEMARKDPRSPAVPARMPDGAIVNEMVDMIAYVEKHAEDLPVILYCVGRRDWYAQWADQVAYARALEKARHGFVFAWNDGDHSSGSAAGRHLPNMLLFARNRSYPAFSNSSASDDPGTGETESGAKEGTINGGFTWKDIIDEAARYAVTIGHASVKEGTAVSVDVTPRRLQAFRPIAGKAYRFTSVPAGGADEVQSGTATADAKGLLTVPQFRITSPAGNVLRIEAAD